MPGLPDARIALLFAIAFLGLIFGVAFVVSLRRLARAATPPAPVRRPSLSETATGFVTTFFDTLGIGNYATTTAIYRASGMVPDDLIPGTLNVGHTPAGVIAAFIFIGLIPVAPMTLAGMIVASGLGAWLGAGLVAHLPRYRIRLGMGSALLIAATLMLLGQVHLLPGGGEALGLNGGALALAVFGNFLLGGLMTLGIGLYAPCMVLICLLGMNPRAAFPIMMGSCAFLTPLSGTRFLREARYHPSASLGLSLGGIPALLIAAYLVTGLPLTVLRWIVVAVVLFTAVTLLRAGWIEQRRLREAAAARSSRCNPKTPGLPLP